MNYYWGFIDNTDADGTYIVDNFVIDMTKVFEYYSCFTRMMNFY